MMYHTRLFEPTEYAMSEAQELLTHYGQISDILLVGEGLRSILEKRVMEGNLIEFICRPRDFAENTLARKILIASHPEVEFFLDRVLFKMTELEIGLLIEVPKPNATVIIYLRDFDTPLFTYPEVVSGPGSDDNGWYKIPNPVKEWLKIEKDVLSQDTGSISVAPTTKRHNLRDSKGHFIARQLKKEVHVKAAL